MCRYNYRGFSCGHIDPEGTPIKHEYCGAPRRLHHEPMCDPPDSYGLTNNGIQNCPRCKEILDRLHAEWTAKRNKWRHDKALPDSLINRVNRQIIGTQANIKLQALKKGPFHTDHQQYEPRQKDIIKEAEALAKSLADIEEEWQENIRVLSSFNTVDPGAIRGCFVRREIARERITTDGLTFFQEYEQELLDELYEIHNENAGLKDDNPV
ncbi:hypothetical protein F5X99DRAFT_421360 [Biscogniauxia marginata]|nr:hypothetical protein F5X99DRAFT_421360 [Biscogniauxia marginata]